MKPLVALLLGFGSIWLIYDDVAGQRHISQLIAQMTGDRRPELPAIFDNAGLIIGFLVLLIILSAINEKLAVGFVVLLIISILVIRYPNIPFLGRS